MTTHDTPRVQRSSPRPGPRPRPPQAPYRVPWRVDRRYAPTFRLVNIGPEPLSGVSLSISGAAAMRATAPRRLMPGECLPVTVRSHDIDRDTVLIVGWFRSDGDEYLWRVSF